MWGAEGAGPLLDWLEVSQRHVLDGPAAGTDLTAIIRGEAEAFIQRMKEQQG